MSKNKEVVSDDRCVKCAGSAELLKRHSDRLQLTVAHRRQTPEEQRQFIAAFDVFLAELVRLNIDRNGRL